MGLSAQTVAATHALDHGRVMRLAFAIVRHRFVGRYVVGQMVFVDLWTCGLVDAPEGSQERTQAGARTFTTVAVDFAHAIAIITRPFLGTTVGGRSR